MDPAGELLQGGVDLGQRVDVPVQAGLHLGRLGVDGGLGGAQVHPERDDALLDAVVQVALDEPARLVGRGDDPRA